ncbi:GRIM-19 protein [Phyllosticta capitalensis]|uniref:NADH dehydrogenase [ubiquinone] 1 alpha subcomplex subunit 13 n=1 Tax=Phyllosticta capitalensis TaxID=121624 RepID=A0ABR1YDG9_9PEZI
MPQDLPPKGGYEQVQYKRNIPARPFATRWYLVAVGVAMGYGWYRMGQGIREKNELAREKMWARIHLMPVLQAEADRDMVRRYYAEKAREKELLGKEIKVYNSDRFIQPTFAATPSTVYPAWEK